MAEENIGICLSGQSRRRAVPHRGWGERAVASGGQRHKYGNADSARVQLQSGDILNARVVLGNTRGGVQLRLLLGILSLKWRSHQTYLGKVRVERQ